MMILQSHNIPQSHLHSFCISGKAGENSATSTEIFINDIKVGTWITEVNFTGEAQYEPIVQVVGLLDKLDEKTRSSWGII